MTASPSETIMDSTYFRVAADSRHKDGGLIIYDSREPRKSSELQLLDCIEQHRDSLRVFGVRLSIIDTGVPPTLTCLLTMPRTSKMKIVTVLNSFPPPLRHYRIAISWSSPAIPAAHAS